MTQVFDCADAARRADGHRVGRQRGQERPAGRAAHRHRVRHRRRRLRQRGRRRLLAAKGRGRDMPVAVLVGSWHTIDGLVYSVPHSARELIRAFWPGALSLVVQQAPSLQWDLGDARGTVMLRMPLHPVAIEVLREVGPMAVSSANISGRPPAVDGRRGAATSWATWSRSTSTPDRRSSRRPRPSSTSPARLRESCARGRSRAAAIAEVLGVDVASLTGLMHRTGGSQVGPVRFMRW